MNLSDDEVDTILDYFRSDARFIHIGATYITPKNTDAPKEMQRIFDRCKNQQAHRPMPQAR